VANPSAILTARTTFLNRAFLGRAGISLNLDTDSLVEGTDRLRHRKHRAPKVCHDDLQRHNQTSIQRGSVASPMGASGQSLAVSGGFSFAAFFFVAFIY
jgi:hypothetical protein